MLGRIKLKDSVQNLPIQQVEKITISKILQNTYQPRKLFTKNGLTELADSIREYGVLQPVSVRKIGGGTYELVAGERRLRASLLAGKNDIPALITNITDED